MINFKTFLEARYAKLPNNVMASWSEKPGTVKQAIKWLVENNDAAIEAGNFIYRGFSGGLENKITFIDSSNGRRVSKDSSGMYQLMMDASDAFKGYPSRSNSFICTTERSDTQLYGEPYIVFPKKGTKIAISEEPDFWHTGISGDAAACYGGADIETLNIRLVRLFKDAFNIRPKRGMTIQEMDDALKDVDVQTFIREMGLSSSKVNQKILDAIQAQGGKKYFTALSNVLATPYTFGVETKVYGQSKLERGTEIWFSGEALFIAPSEMEEILKKLPDEINIARAINKL